MNQNEKTIVCGTNDFIGKCLIANSRCCSSRPVSCVMP